MRRLLLVFALVILACSGPITTPGAPADAAQDGATDGAGPTPSLDTNPPSQWASGPRDAGPPPKLRYVPADPRIVACTKNETDKDGLMRCLGALEHVPPALADAGHRLGETRPPIICGAQSIPAWFVSRSHGLDSNTCTDAAHECQHYYEIKGRWGCGGSATTRPRSSNTIGVTFTTPDPMDGLDPIDFDPNIQNDAYAYITETLPAPVASGTLAGVVAKSNTFVAPQLLNATLAAGLAPGQMIVNTTHPSTAWIYKLVSGTTWAISQPIRPVSLPDAISGILGKPAEVDTWANGDSYAVYQLGAVDLRSVSAQVGPFASGAGIGSAVYVYRVSVPTTGGYDAIRTLGVGSTAVIAESNFGITLTGNPGIGPSQNIPNAYANDYMAGGIALHSLDGMPGDLSGGVVWGGVIGGSAAPLSESGQIYGGRIDDDVILGQPSAYILFNAEIDNVYVETGALLATGGTIIMTNGAHAWGPGQLCAHQGNISYQTLTAVDGLRTATLGIGITCTNVAFAIKTSAGVSELSSLPLTAVNLDSLTGFNGEAFLPNGSAFRKGQTAPPGTTQCPNGQTVESNGTIFTCQPFPVGLPTCTNGQLPQFVGGSWQCVGACASGFVLEGAGTGAISCVSPPWATCPINLATCTTGTLPLTSVASCGVNGQIVQTVSGAQTCVTVSADATMAAGGAVTLATVATAGTTGDSTHVAQVTIDAKGRVTLATPVALSTFTGPACSLHQMVLSDGATGFECGPVPAASGIPVVSNGTTFVEGTAKVPGGGTGDTTLTPANGVLIAQVNAPVAVTAAGATGIPLIGQTGAPPVFGTAVVGGGGTGVTSTTSHGIQVGEGTAPFQSITPGAVGTLLGGQGGANPAFTSYTLDAPGALGTVLTSTGPGLAWTAQSPLGASCFQRGSAVNLPNTTSILSPNCNITAPVAGNVMIMAHININNTSILSCWNVSFCISINSVSGCSSSSYAIYTCGSDVNVDAVGSVGFQTAIAAGATDTFRILGSADNLSTIAVADDIEAWMTN
jgi:hypothetical protein